MLEIYFTDEVTTNSDIAVTDRKQRRPKAIVRRDSLEAYFAGY